MRLQLPRVRYGLRLLLGLVFILSLAFGWIRFEKDRMLRQRVLLTEIERRGAHVFSAAKMRQLGFPVDVPPALPWHRRALGETPEDHPLMIVLTKAFGNEDLAHLSRCTSLKYVVLGDAGVSETAVSELQSRLPGCEIKRSLFP